MAANVNVCFGHLIMMAVIAISCSASVPNHPSSSHPHGQQTAVSKIGCPNEFMAKYKNASAVCQKETSALFRSMPGDTSIFSVAVNGRFKRNEKNKESNEKVDSEIVLCTYQKLKQIPALLQIANLEKECTSNDSTKPSDKTSDEEDAETGLANCLMEKMEAMCPALAATV